MKCRVETCDDRGTSRFGFCGAHERDYVTCAHGEIVRNGNTYATPEKCWVALKSGSDPRLCAKHRTRERSCASCEKPIPRASVAEINLDAYDSESERPWFCSFECTIAWAASHSEKDLKA